MGIYDRDYYREGPGSFMDSWGRRGATVWLILVTAVIFVLDQLSRDRAPFGEITNLGGYSRDLIANGEVWRLLTGVFIDPDPLRMILNLLILYWAGTRIQDSIGNGEFLAFYLVAGILANLGTFLLQIAGLPGGFRSGGSSGAVMAVLVLFACYYPRQRVLLFFVLSIRIWNLILGYFVLGFFCLIRSEADLFGVICQVCGATAGFAYYRLGFRITQFAGRGVPQVRPNRTRLRVVSIEPNDPDNDSFPPALPAYTPEVDEEPSPEVPFEARVDEVLAKVLKQGQASLTSEEREILFLASERYKKKRK